MLCEGVPQPLPPWAEDMPAVPLLDDGGCRGKRAPITSWCAACAAPNVHAFTDGCRRLLCADGVAGGIADGGGHAFAEVMLRSSASEQREAALALSFRSRSFEAAGERAGEDADWSVHDRAGSNYGWRVGMDDTSAPGALGGEYIYTV